MQFRILFFFAKLDNNLDMYYILQKKSTFFMIYLKWYELIYHTQKKKSKRKNGFVYLTTKYALDAVGSSQIFLPTQNLARAY